MSREIWLEEMLSVDRYIIMEHVSYQTKEFRFAEIYFLLKKIDSIRWQAEDVKMILEWLADIGLIRRKLKKVKHGQKWLFYQPCFNHDFLLSRIKQGDSGTEDRAYKCRGIVEILRYKYACVKEVFNRVSWKTSYTSPFVIAEKDFALSMTLEEKRLLNMKIEELDK